MKILHTESSCGWGGQELRVLSEIAGMRARGHEVTLAAPPEATILREARTRGLDVLALPMRDKRPAGVRALRHLLKSRPVDVVVTHSSTDTWLVALARLGWRTAPPLVRTRHISAPIPRNPATRWLYQRATAHVVTTGESLRLQVIAETGLSPERVTSVPTGIDLRVFRPRDRNEARTVLGLPADAFIVGIVATLRSWKGHAYLVEAVVDMPDARLVIVGDGPGRENLIAQAQKLGIADRVLMAGHHSDVAPWLQSFDVFALPSYANEGVPQAIMQAMACRIPVVTTAVGAIGEIARNDETALIVTPRDALALREALVRLSTEPALGRRLAEAALEQARGRFSVEVMLDRMEAVLAKMIGQQPLQRRGT